MNTLRLTFRMLLRDLRAGELTILALALVLAVTALTSVGFLADRVERAVAREAYQLLGGDLLLTADHPWPESFRAAAQRHGLRLAESVSFVSMVASAGGVQLAEIKAVSDGYPLYGALRIAPRLNVGDGATAAIPAPGTVWPDERLATGLGVDNDVRLRLGALEPTVAAIVTLEPDRGINPFALAPRLIINLADVPATQLIQPGSRVSWRLHVAGDAPAVAKFRQWVQQHLQRGEKLETLDNARPEIRNIIERAQRFLRLAALLTVVLAAVAVGMAARRYMQTHLDACAVMRCLGASERQILLIHGGEFIVLGLAATLLGGGLGYLAQGALHMALAGLIAEQLPAPGWLPMAHGLAVGSVLVAGFVLPPLLRLKAVPTVRVLRREWSRSEPLSAISYLLGMACLAGLMLWMANDLRLGSVVLGGFMLAVAVFALAGQGLLVLIGRLPTRLVTGGWRIGLANLRRRAGATLVQVVALALGLTTLLILTLAKDDLLSAWQSKTPPDAPNRFLINIQPDQRGAITDFFAARGLPAPRLEPMVRGRLTSVNGRKVAPRDFVDERAQRLVEREFNLSSRDDLPTGNQIVAGRWHVRGQGTGDRGQMLSVEKGLAETLNLHIGDELAFDIAGQPFVAQIASLRKLEWDSMRVNFFVIAPAGSMDDQPTSFITSFHLPDGSEAIIGDLVRQFPNLTVIDVAALVRQLRDTLDQVARAVQLVFGFALLAGLVVLYAALQASAGERSHELAVLRALGGRRHQLRQALFAEFATLGALAGLLAGLAATAIGTALARWVFQLDYLPTPSLVLVGLLAGLAGVALAGLIATRRALSGQVVDGLRGV
ncbi:MAG: FtsX-like permease family protein [Rhodocyclaceae bacterium]|nr:FtsX-like permease family protein [Rhodocyclaceae bacterium]